MIERLQSDLDHATAELKAHMASWAYAFAMGAGNHGGQNHPVHVATRERTEQLQARCRDLRAQLAEHRV
jgi:Tfp pilus assembly protein FimV